MTELIDSSHPAYAGQASYTPKFLKHVYDPLVVRFANRFAWRCPSRRILRLYDEHVASTHVDAGPGTGWFLDRCRFPTDRPEILLLDVNANVLDAASRRIARYQPATHPANLLEPIAVEPASFGSAALAHVLHCLPGTIGEKAVVLDNVTALVRPGGTVFGSTVLNGGVKHTRFSRGYVDYLNESGIFSNLDDDLEGLALALSDRFERYELRVEGAVALFAGCVE